jgi:hypothetical protein
MARSVRSTGVRLASTRSMNGRYGRLIVGGPDRSIGFGHVYLASRIAWLVLGQAAYALAEWSVLSLPGGACGDNGAWGLIVRWPRR